MRSYLRLLVALTILLSAGALLPFVALPSEAFSWQQYAGAYELEAALGINYDIGKPGSVFIITGQNFAPNSQATVIVNGQALSGAIDTGTGDFNFSLQTSSTAAPGVYIVTVTDSNETDSLPITASSASTVSYRLDSEAPLRTEQSDPILIVPADIPPGSSTHLPIMLRSPS